eukprot:251580-Prymnesium_polylepis.2
MRGRPLVCRVTAGDHHHSGGRAALFGDVHLEWGRPSPSRTPAAHVAHACLLRTLPASHGTGASSSSRTSPSRASSTRRPSPSACTSALPCVLAVSAPTDTPALTRGRRRRRSHRPPPVVPAPRLHPAPPASPPPPFAAPAGGVATASYILSGRLNLEDFRSR